jgi:hypothetical protein
MKKQKLDVLELLAIIQAPAVSAAAKEFAQNELDKALGLNNQDTDTCQATPAKKLGPVTDRIKTFADVLTESGISPMSFTEMCEDLEKDEIAYRKLKLIVSVLNEGWVPDFLNEREYKYTPYFKRSTSGFGFSITDYVSWFTFTFVGSRLVFKTSELAEYAAKQFADVYNDFLL